MDVVLTKHHGLGNDFLVVDLDGNGLDASSCDWAEVAQRLCDRRRGIGADGLLLMGTRDGALTMRLHNADGSRAEMSGNGIRCLVQAGLHAYNMKLSSVDVVTDAGRRTVDVIDTNDEDLMMLSVSMGVVAPAPEPARWLELGCHPDRPVRHSSLGNPHSVVGVDDVTDVDLAELGSKVPDINLEIVAPGPTTDSIIMRVHERGVGVTEACGTGACAAAEAALSWGLAIAGDDGIAVHMDGGTARVIVDRTTSEAVLVGPAQFIGTVQVVL